MVDDHNQYAVGPSAQLADVPSPESALLDFIT